LAESVGIKEKWPTFFNFAVRARKTNGYRLARLPEFVSSRVTLYVN
jgi:hypothetical protein